MRTVVNLSNILLTIGRGGIAGLEFVNGEEKYKYNLVCNREFTVLVKISLKTLKDYVKKDLNKHLKPLYMDQERISNDFFDKYKQFKKCMKVTFKSNHNSYLKKSEEEKVKARDICAETSLHNLRSRHGKSISFYHPKNEYTKMNILINNIADLSNVEDPVETKNLSLRKPSIYTHRQTLKPIFIRNTRRNSSIAISAVFERGNILQKSQDKPLYITTLTKYVKQAPSSSAISDHTTNYIKNSNNFSLFNAELDKICKPNKRHVILNFYFRTR
jgi:hypothetical protein